MSESAAPSRLSIVLIRPDSPKNIGLAAQGMARTGVTDLCGDGLADGSSRRIGHRVGEYEYYLQKLKEHYPRQSASRKGENGTRKSLPSFGSEKRGQPAKTEYILGAVLARLVRGRNGTVQWMNIRIQIVSLTTDSKGRRLYHLDDINEGDLRVHCSRLKKKHGNQINRFSRVFGR